MYGDRGRRRAGGLFWLACLLAAGTVGCGNSGMQSAKNSVDSLQEVVTIFKSVQDDASARAAVGKVKPAFDKLADSLAETLAHEMKQGIRGAKTEVNQIEQDVARLQLEMKSESDRLESLHGLPREFWDEARLASAELAQSIISAAASMAADTLGLDMSALDDVKSPLQELIDAYKQHGPAQVVELTIRGGRYFDQQEAVARLQKIAGPDAKAMEVPNEDEEEATTVAFAPVEDVEAFHDAINFGTVADFFPERCGIILEVTEELAGPYAGMEPEEIAEQKRIDDERAAQEKQQQEEAERLAAEQREREAEEERRRLEEEERQRPPERGQPNYHAKLLANVQDPQAPHHQLAVEHLLGMKPTDVEDKEIRKGIALAFRNLATSTGGFGGGNRSDAVEGLVIWAGKYSVPVLLGMVNDAAQQIDAAVLAGLGKYPSAEGAAALAPLLKNEQNREAAVEALSAMGALAEEPVLKLLPDPEPKVNIAALEVLGKCGTKASLKIMRDAARSENEEVAEAAREAAASIRKRDEQ